MQGNDTIVRVGVAVILMKNNKVLLGKRKGSHGAGFWALPGGHMEFGETVAQTAKRELIEETGIAVKQVTLGPYTNDFMPKENKHYITLFAIAKTTGEPILKEPEKCAGWQWFAWDNLPKPLFLPVKHLLKIKRSVLE